MSGYCLKLLLSAPFRCLGVAIDADKDVKIYREEIYYQIKLANLVGKNTDTKATDSIENLLKEDNLRLNDKIETTAEATEIQLEKPKKTKSIIIKKQPNN